MYRTAIGRYAALFATLLYVPPLAFAAETYGHGDPAAPVVLYLAIVLAAAKLGGVWRFG
jgi:hypothetical protein